jgi:hypothetical protein
MQVIRQIFMRVSPKFKQTYETYLALHDALMVRKHPANLANLLATCEPNGAAIDMTIATLKRHKVAVLNAITSPIPTVRSKGLTASSSHSNDPVLASKISRTSSKKSQHNTTKTAPQMENRLK